MPVFALLFNRRWPQMLSIQHVRGAGKKDQAGICQLFLMKRRDIIRLTMQQKLGKIQSIFIVIVLLKPPCSGFDGCRGSIVTRMLIHASCAYICLAGPFIARIYIYDCVLFSSVVIEVPLLTYALIRST